MSAPEAAAAAASERGWAGMEWASERRGTTWVAVLTAGWRSSERADTEATDTEATDNTDSAQSTDSSGGVYARLRRPPGIVDGLL